MKWEEIDQFDEINTEHVQALRQRCLEGGHVAYTMRQRHGWQALTAPEVAKIALAFALNMLSEKSFSDLTPLYVASPYGQRWIETMREWWMEGYHQARNTEETAERQCSDQHAGAAATVTLHNERSATHVRDDFAG